MPAKVRARMQKTPSGATYMTSVVIFIMISLNCSNRRWTVSTRLPKTAITMPQNSAKKMMGSMSPLASAPMGFWGTMLSTVSAMESSSAAATVAWAGTTDPMSTPLPGLIRVATPRATATATAVVKR